jgi:hypothetical protein
MPETGSLTVSFVFSPGTISSLPAPFSFFFSACSSFLAGFTGVSRSVLSGTRTSTPVFSFFSAVFAAASVFSFSAVFFFSGSATFF